MECTAHLPPGFAVRPKPCKIDMRMPGQCDCALRRKTLAQLLELSNKCFVGFEHAGPLALIKTFR
ncbi:hypothetical protein AJ87_38725 [Rhizobium yanglingense]|nr:hypothetical protein AJ87_38725 [Rhizobium yanglingense]